MYKVGPSKVGRIRTYQGYFDKVRNELTYDDLDKLSTVTPYATGATMKDLVNESLITAIRDGREVITWRDVMKAKQLKELGPVEDVEYIERERHAVAVHELPRCRRVPRPRPPRDRPCHDREGQRLPRHGGEHPAGGPVHPLADRVRGRHPRVTRVASASGCSSRPTTLLACPATRLGDGRRRADGTNAGAWAA